MLRVNQNLFKKNQWDLFKNNCFQKVHLVAIYRTSAVFLTVRRIGTFEKKNQNRNAIYRFLEIRNVV